MQALILSYCPVSKCRLFFSMQISAVFCYIGFINSLVIYSVYLDVMGHFNRTIKRQSVEIFINPRGVVHIGIKSEQDNIGHSHDSYGDILFV